MTYEIYQYVFLGGLAASCIMLMVSVVLFFMLHIPRAISDISGRTERKAIENIRIRTQQANDKEPFSHTGGNKQTDKITSSGRLARRGTRRGDNRTMTEKISTQRTGPAGEAAPTDVLAVAEDTTVLYPRDSETTVLVAPTAVQPAFQTVPQAPDVAFVVEHEITFIHTNEVIG